MVNINIALEDWIYQFTKTLQDAGLSETKAMSILLKQYGNHGVKANIETCPNCCAEKWLIKNGMIPANNR